MIKRTVVCDNCHEAEAKYYTGENMNVVYCEKCIMENLNAQVDCLRCSRCARKIQNTEFIQRKGLPYCSVECLIKNFFGESCAGELDDTQKEFLIANG